MGIPVDFPTIVETYGIVTPPQRRPFEGRSESAISDQMSLMLVPAEVIRGLRPPPVPTPASMDIPHTDPARIEDIVGPPRREKPWTTRGRPVPKSDYPFGAEGSGRLSMSASSPFG